MSVLTIILALVAILLVASWYLATGFWSKVLTHLSLRQAGLVSRQSRVDGINWHYLEGGHGPVLLLIHGFGADTSCWLPLARSFGQRFTLLIPDLPGFGQSEPPNHLDFDIRSQTSRLMAFLDSLGIERCLVAGNSMGGYLAASLAASDPSRVQGVWLLAPLGVNSVSPGAALEAIDAGEVVAGEVLSTSQFKQDIVKPLFSRRIWLPYPILRAQAQDAIRRRFEVPRMLKQVRFESEPLEEIARQVNQPVLLEWGDEDRILNPAGLDVLTGRFCDCEAHLVTKCGHLPMFELPGESARLFKQWLKQKRLPS